MDVDIDALIVEVRKRPTLYDSTRKEYHDRRLKKELWHEVCCKLLTPEVWNSLNSKQKMKFETEVVKKWNSLRTCFRRELRVNTCINDGVLERLKKKKKYIYFDDLVFLLPYTKDYPNVDDSTLEDDGGSDVLNFSEDDISESKYSMTHAEEVIAEPIPVTIKAETMLEIERLSEHGELSDGGSSVSHTRSDLTPPNKKKKVTHKNDNKHTQAKEDIQKTKVRLSDVDEDEGFLSSLLPSLKEFSTEDKLRLRVEIITTILNFKKSLNSGTSRK